MIRYTRPFVALVIATLLIGGPVSTALATDTISDGKVVRWVQKTVAERQPQAEDKRFDEIGWVTDIRTAMKLGQAHNRPIYLLTVDGRINTGRC